MIKQVFACAWACAVVASALVFGSGCGAGELEDFEVADAGEPECAAGEALTVIHYTRPNDSGMLHRCVPFDPTIEQEVERKAFAYNFSYRHGAYSAGTESDGRCLAGGNWGNNICTVSGTKTFRVHSYLTGSWDFTAQGAMSVMSQAGYSFSRQTSNTNVWIDLWPSSLIDQHCPAGSIACTAWTPGNTFTWNGKKFRKTVLANAFGWPEPVYAGIALNDDVIWTQTAGLTSTQKTNWIRNTIEHELGHVATYGHNPSSNPKSVMNKEPVLPEWTQNPGVSLRQNELDGAAAYTP